MAKSQIHVNDGPTKFRSQIQDEAGNLDLTTSTMQYIFKKPNATVETFDATMDASDTKMMEYSTESGYFKGLPGVWEWEAKVTISGGVYFSDIGQFSVFPVLE